MIVDIPCKIGDTAWAIRNYSGQKKIIQGTVSEMYFIDESMRLVIVVKHVARGYWGKTIFGSYEEAKTYLEEKENENQH